MTKPKEISEDMSYKIKGVTLSDDLKFSESFIAELDKALNDYHQKQGQSSQRASTPHVRIEFDDINDVPHVWIDGKRIGDEYPLKRINLEWNTNDAYIEPKQFLIDYFDMTKEAGAVAEQYGPQTQQRGVGQSNGVVRRSSAPRSEEEYHVQFPITAHTDIRAGQAIRLDRMELAASIRATNSDDCFAGVVYLIWDHH